MSHIQQTVPQSKNIAAYFYLWVPVPNHAKSEVRAQNLLRDDSDPFGIQSKECTENVIITVTTVSAEGVGNNSHKKRP